MLETKEVWLNLKNQDKPVLVNLTDRQIGLLTDKGQMISGYRVNKDGEKSVFGFNTDNVNTFNYKEEMTESESE